MKKLIILAVLAISSIVYAQQLAFSMKKDTAVYDEGGFGNSAVELYFIRSPGVFYTSGLFPIVPGTTRSEGHDFLIAQHKKNSTQWDIFSMAGKIGGFVLPATPAALNLIVFYITQTFLRSGNKTDYY